MAKLYSLPLELAALRAMCGTRTGELKRHGYFAARLTQEDFHTSEAQEVFRAIRSYVAHKGHPPAFTFLCDAPQVSRATRDVFKSARTPPTSRAECDGLIANLQTFRKTRSAYVMAKSVLEALEGTRVNLDEVVELVTSAQASFHVNRALDDCFFHVGRDSNTLGMVHDILNSEADDQWVPTTWKTFDSVNGGMPRGGLVLVSAPSGVGKSHTVLHLAKAQAELGYKTIVVPLEMSEREQMTRFIANASGVDSLRVTLKRLSVEERLFVYRKFKRLNRKIEEANGRFTIFRPKEDLTIEETLDACHAFNPDAVYIDYIGLLSGADGDDQWRKLGSIARHGKVYAGNHDKIVCMAAQVDDATGRLRYSQAVKEHASLAFVLTPHGGMGKDVKRTGLTDVSMLKGRNQSMMNFQLKIDYDLSRVRDLTEEELQALGTPAPPTPPSGAKQNAAARIDSFVPDLSE